MRETDVYPSWGLCFQRAELAAKISCDSLLKCIWCSWLAIYFLTSIKIVTVRETLKLQPVYTNYFFLHQRQWSYFCYFSFRQWAFFRPLGRIRSSKAPQSSSLGSSAVIRKSCMGQPLPTPVLVEAAKRLLLARGPCQVEMDYMCSNLHQRNCIPPTKYLHSSCRKTKSTI